jgi:hypothetical protein
MQRLQNACLASANAFALGMKGLAVRDIAAEIRATAVPAGAIAPWWLGQLSFVLKGQARTVGIDPYLFEYLARFHPEQPCHYMARGERFIYFPCR